MNDPTVDELVGLVAGNDHLMRRLEEMMKGPGTVEAISERPVGGSIRALRGIAGDLSPAELSERCGLPEEFLEEVEEETGDLDLPSFEAIAAALELRPSHLMLIVDLARALAQTMDRHLDGAGQQG